MSNLGRKVHRDQIKRSRKLWRKLRRNGREHGLACLTCEAWLSPPLDSDDARAQLFRNHQIRCPRLMITDLDLRKTPQGKSGHSNVPPAADVGPLLEMPPAVKANARMEKAWRAMSPERARLTFGVAPEDVEVIERPPGAVGDSIVAAVPGPTEPVLLESIDPDDLAAFKAALMERSPGEGLIILPPGVEQRRDVVHAALLEQVAAANADAVASFDGREYFGTAPERAAQDAVADEIEASWERDK